MKRLDTVVLFTTASRLRTPLCVFLIAVVARSQSHCHSLHFTFPPDEFHGQHYEHPYQENNIYAGTRTLVNIFRPVRHLDWRDRLRSIVFGFMFWLDMPGSFVMDTLLLPYTIPYTLIKTSRQNEHSDDPSLRSPPEKALDSPTPFNNQPDLEKSADVP